MSTTMEDFDARLDPFRGELLVHCYQMLGSVHDAEDQVQETLLRAWRARDQYDEGRASLRTWLHRIATNTCLTALQGRARRPLPSGIADPSDDPTAPLVPATDVSWLQPLPDWLLGGDPQDPAVRLAAQGRLRLALVAAMQLLPARQRAIVIMRDVLDLSALETAAALDTTTAAVNSGLQRARARLADFERTGDEPEPSDAETQKFLDRYVDAFERADVAALQQVLTDDVLFEMPPVANWFIGPDLYGRFMTRMYERRGTDWRHVPIVANGQPGFAAYVRAPGDDLYRAHTIQVFAATSSGISRNNVFQDDELFPLFGLPTELRDGDPPLG